MKTKDKSSNRPAITLEARENQLIAKAVALAEQQLNDGTASSQIISHYLKLGTERERLKIEQMKAETELLYAKTENLKQLKRQDELCQAAINAMRAYSGLVDDVDE